MSGGQVTRDWQKSIDCGDLFDVSYEAYDARLLHPTAISAKAWDKYVRSWEHEGPGEAGIEIDRLRIILSMLRFHLARGGTDGYPFVFSVPKDPKPVHLYTWWRPREDGRPVITIDLPPED
jgi:hypothetical protein